MTTRSVDKGASIFSMIEFNSTVIHRVIKKYVYGTHAVYRQLYLRLLVEALLTGEPQGGSVWRSRLEVLGIMVTDATSPFDHLQTMGSIPVEGQNHAGRHLDTRDAHDRGSSRFWKVKNALHWTIKEAEQEEHRKHLRQQPRHRRKEI